jgi:flagellar protein FlaG
MDIRPTDNTPQARGLGAASPGAAPARAAKAVDAPAKPDPVQQAAAAPGKEELAQALASINDLLQDRSPGLEFSIDSGSARSIVKVVDKDTQEVIRQMPSREAIEIAKALDKLQSLLVKQTA